MSWMDLVAAGKTALAAVADTAAAHVHAEVAQYIELDVANRRIFVADALLREALRRAVEHHQLELLDFTRIDNHHAIEVRTASGVVCVTVGLTKFSWHGENLQIHFTTSSPLEVQDRPIATLLIAVLAAVVGGTWVGEAIFSMAVPDAVRWNGRSAVAEFPLPSAMVPPLVKGSDVALDVPVTLTDLRGIWLEFSDGAMLRWLWSLLLERCIALIWAARHPNR